MSEVDLYWIGEVVYGTVVTLEAHRDDWRSQPEYGILIRIASRSTVDKKKIAILYSVLSC